MIAVPPLVAAKLAVYAAMREQGTGEAELARRLGVTSNAARTSRTWSGRWRTSACSSR